MGSNKQHATAVPRGTDQGGGSPDVTIEVRADGQESVADDDPAALRSEIERLREELDRRETELQLVVERYERQLERRDRPPEERTSELRVETPHPGRSTVRRAIRRLFARFPSP